MSNIVYNQQPTIPSNSYKLAIIGEAPGQDEETLGLPFVGTSGKLLWALANNAGILRSACFVGNISQVRPPGNDIKAFAWEGPEIQQGLIKLKEDIELFKPNCILLLGSTPLRAAGIEHPVTSFRGTTFQCRETTSPFFQYKCLSTLHPAYVLRDYSTMPLFDFDIRRAFKQAHFADYKPPQRFYDVELTAAQICERLDAIRDGEFVSVDIEGGVTQGISCIGVSLSPSSAFIVNPPDFSIEEQLRIFKSLARVLSSEKIPKILQNALYDCFCIAWKWKIPVRNVVHDTMLSGWEIYPELPKGLDTQSSIWTEEPYYKYQRKIDDKLTHYKYCCTDAAVTYEIARKHMETLQAASKAHFEFNMQLLPAMHYMELRGIKYDAKKAADRLQEITATMRATENRFNTAAGVTINPNCNNGKNSLANILYRTLGFEPQYKKEHGRKTNSFTADVEALLHLAKSTNSPIIRDILQWRVLEGQRKQLEVSADRDGRVRCSYNLVGTDTGRLTCYESPTGSGTNLQTIMKKNRDLYVADDDFYFFQCDLSGADGWTVAAHCKALGDDTMMNDYLYGIKPARVVAAMYVHGFSIASLPPEQLKEVIKNTTINEGLYFTCKRVQHGSNYMMGKITMSSVILKDFWKVNGEVNYVTPKQCEALQALYLRGRYKGVVKWQEYVKKTIERTKQLPCASGHVRSFFGRPHDLETIKAALSHEPQANTTYATNLALHKLWNDPTNRRPDGSLIIEPLHQVHDALCGQFPKSQAKWAVEKIRQYFNNPLQIANQTLTIPFEGFYGSSWGDLKTPI